MALSSSSLPAAQPVAKSRSGLQSIQRTGVIVTVYPLADRGITQKGGDVRTYAPVTFDGTSAASSRPCVISCTTTNALQSGGSFSVTVKAAQYGPLMDSLSDDSWVDISFTNNGKSWHVMRGLIDEVRQTQSLGGSGAYAPTHTIIGRSFQKIWADTSYWFNPNSVENLNGADIYRLLDSFGGTSPQTIIKTFLQEVLGVLEYYGRSAWKMPPQMKGLKPEFASSVDLFVSDYNFYGLPLTMLAGSVLQQVGTGDLWSIAQQFSDAAYTELFTEQALYTKDKVYVDLDGTKGLSTEDTQMSVVFRDKPFLTVDPVLPADKIARKGPFFKLPVFQVAREMVQATDLGISGYERYNAFFTTPPISTGSTQGIFQYYQRPLWFPEDVQKHGLRRMDISSAYLPDSTQFASYGSSLNTDTFMQRRRALIKDWYCLGAMLRSGTLSLGCGAPHLKVGCRLQIPPDSSQLQNESYYIETVTHSWGMPQGTRTQVGVTRGFVGTDDQLIATLRQVSKNYYTAKGIGDG